jgi:hypothetical protein
MTAAAERSGRYVGVYRVPLEGEFVGQADLAGVAM